METILNGFISFVGKNLRNPKLYVGVAVLIVLFFLVFPYIDANFFYYDRIEKRIDILQKITEIDTEKLSENAVLKNEYNKIISEIEKQEEFSISNALNTDYNNYKWGKFISGGILVWFVAIWALFMKTVKGLGMKAITFLILAVFGIVLGFIATSIPTIIDPWVNYIGIPLVEIFIVGAFALKQKQT